MEWKLYEDVTDSMRLRMRLIGRTDLMIPGIRVGLGKCLYDFQIIGIHYSRLPSK